MQQQQTSFRLMGFDIHYNNQSSSTKQNPFANCGVNTTNHSKLMAITAHDSSLISPKKRHCHVLCLDNDSDPVSQLPINNAKKFKGEQKIVEEEHQNEGCFLLFGVRIGIPKDEILKNYHTADSTASASTSTSTSSSSSSTVTNNNTTTPMKIISAQPLNWNFPRSPYFDHFCYHITTNLGGDNVILILQKSLQMTDCDALQSRLSLPRNHLLTKQFLTESEEEWLDMKDQHTGKLNTLPLILIDPCLHTWDGDRSLHISKWNYYQKKKADAEQANEKKKSVGCSYALKTNWNKLKKQNDLKQDDIIQVWSFRVQGKLGLALIRL